MNLSEIMQIKDGVVHFDFTNTIQYLEYKGKEKFGKHFKIHPVDFQVIHKLLSWMIKDREGCKKHEISLSKGILLVGPVGCGKTSIMTLLCDLTKKSRAFYIKPARQITLEFTKQGYDVIHKYTRSVRSPIPLCLDDIGVELPMKYFGTPVNVIGEILLSRYDLFVSKKLLTHGTTNLNSEELEERYGTRVRSRLREMFNLIYYDENTFDKRQ